VLDDGRTVGVEDDDVAETHLTGVELAGRLLLGAA
jgi:hypothetical protein